MVWEIGFSKQAENFLKQHHLPSGFAIEPIRKVIRRLQGEIVAINIKRLSGKWEGCSRVRVGKNRIIFSINFEKQIVLIEIIDNRSDAYR